MYSAKTLLIVCNTQHTNKPLGERMFSGLMERHTMLYCAVLAVLAVLCSAVLKKLLLILCNAQPTNTSLDRMFLEVVERYTMRYCAELAVLAVRCCAVQ